MRKINIICLILICLCLASCDNHEHKFSELKVDEDNHYYECECGEKSNYASHNYNEIVYDEEYHWSICVCKASSKKVKHSFNSEVVTKIQTDLLDGELSSKCRDCEYTKTTVIPKINGVCIDTYPSLSNADVVIYKDIIYTYGGSPDGSNRTDSIYSFDTRNNNIYKLDVKLKKESTSHRAVLIEDKVYIFGGIRSGEKMDCVLIHDLTNQTLIELDVKMPYGLNCAQIGYFGNKIYIIGGLTSGGVTNQIYEFDTTTNIFTKVQIEMDEKIFKGAWCSVGKFVYIIGGINGSRLDTIYRFDMELHTFEKMNGKLPKPIAQLRALYNGDGNIYIYGGTDNSGRLLKEVFKYNISDDLCTLESCELPYSIANTCVVNNGDTNYILGGNNDIANIILAHKGNEFISLR